MTIPNRTEQQLLCSCPRCGAGVWFAAAIGGEGWLKPLGCLQCNSDFDVEWQPERQVLRASIHDFNGATETPMVPHTHEGITHES